MVQTLLKDKGGVVMKKLLLVFVYLFMVITTCFSDTVAGAVAGVEYNPLNPDYISITAGLYVGSQNGFHSFVYEFRFGGGIITQSWEEKNRYSLAQEMVTRQYKAGLFYLHNSFYWQYDLNSIIGLRAGITVPLLITDALGTINLPLALGVYGRAGVVLFPVKRFNLAIEAYPGIIGGSYNLPVNQTPFVLPLTLLVGYSFIPK